MKVKIEAEAAAMRGEPRSASPIVQGGDVVLSHGCVVIVRVEESSMQAENRLSVVIAQFLS